MQNIMLDLETMGTSPNAAIVAIGAVKFDPDTGELGDKFYMRVSLRSSTRYGGVIDADTVYWWLGQSEEARNELTKAGGEPLDFATKEFLTFAGLDKNLCLWGNGSDFDNAILASAYLSVGWNKPFWNPFNNRCYRTVKNLFPDIKLERTGTHHNSLDDAISQAEHLCRIFKHMRGDA